MKKDQTPPPNSQEKIPAAEQELKPEVESGDAAFASASSKPKQVLVTDEELRSLQKEVMEYKDKYLRLLADSENARKRMQKEKQENSRYAIESIVVDILRPLDNLENALRFAQGMSDDVRNWALGFQMILTQFKDILTQHGVTSFDSIEKMFNPHDHEAIEMVETEEYPAGIIIEEHVRGYRMGDRTIRAARVKVAKAPEKSDIEEKL